MRPTTTGRVGVPCLGLTALAGFPCRGFREGLLAEDTVRELTRRWRGAPIGKGRGSASGGFPISPLRMGSDKARVRIIVPQEHRAVTVGILLRSGGARALAGGQFDVTPGQAAMLAFAGLDHKVVGRGEPVRDSIAPQVQ